MTRIVRGSAPAAGVITLTPRSDVLAFLYNTIWNRDDLPTGDMIIHSGTLSTEEKIHMMEVLTSSRLEERAGHLYDVGPSKITMVWVPGEVFDHGKPLWVGETPIRVDQFTSAVSESKRLTPALLRWVSAIQTCGLLTFKDGIQDSFAYGKDAASAMQRPEYSETVVWNQKAKGFRLPLKSESIAATAGAGNQIANILGIYNMTGEARPEWKWDSPAKNDGMGISTITRLFRNVE